MPLEDNFNDGNYNGWTVCIRTLEVNTDCAPSKTSAATDSHFSLDNIRIASDDLSSTATYAYDDANEMTSMTEGKTGIAGSTTTFTYDGCWASQQLMRCRPAAATHDWSRTITRSMASPAHQAAYQYRYGDKVKRIDSTFSNDLENDRKQKRKGGTDPCEATGRERRRVCPRLFSRASHADVTFFNSSSAAFFRRRLAVVDSTDWTWWRWDLGWNMIAEYDDPDTDWDLENQSRTYIPGLAEIMGADASTGTYRYYSTDNAQFASPANCLSENVLPFRLGSVRRIRDDSMASLANYEFTPYGGMYHGSGLALNKGYTCSSPERTAYAKAGTLSHGHMWDPAANMYFAPFRYYTPGHARWLTRDPLGMVDGPNVYGYVGGNPSTRIDREGLFLDTLWDILMTGYDLIFGSWGDVALDVGALLIPCVPAGLGKLDDGIRILRRVEKGADGAESIHLIERVGEETLSVTHKVTLDGKAIHQHKSFVPKHKNASGKRINRQFPDEWPGVPDIGCPE